MHILASNKILIFHRLTAECRIHHRVDEDLAVPRLAGVGGIADEVDEPVGVFVLHHHLRLHLGEKLHLVVSGPPLEGYPASGGPARTPGAAGAPFARSRPPGALATDRLLWIGAECRS